MRELELLARHGPATKLTVNAFPSSLAIGGVGSHYFVLPVSEVLKAGACDRKGSVYVTGVSVELDVLHASAVDFFAVCVPFAAHLGLPEQELDAGSQLFSLGGASLESKQREPALQVDADVVQALGSACFSEKSRDGTLFEAPMKAGVCPKGEVRLDKRRMGHTGRASLSFSRRGDAHGSLVDRYVREKVRLWWAFDRVVDVIDPSRSFVDNRWAVLCGVRSQSQEMMGKAAADVRLGSIKDVRVTVHTHQMGS